MNENSASSNIMAVSGIEKGKESEEMMEDDSNCPEQSSSLDIALISDTTTNTLFMDTAANSLVPDTSSNTISGNPTNPFFPDDTATNPLVPDASINVIPDTPTDAFFPDTETNPLIPDTSTNAIPDTATDALFPDVTPNDLIPDTPTDTVSDTSTETLFSDTPNNPLIPNTPTDLLFSNTPTNTTISDATTNPLNSAAKSFCEVEELIEQMHSEEPFKLDEKIQTDEKKSASSPSLSVQNASFTDEICTESSEVEAELNNLCKEALRSYNGVRKDNKEDLGRGIEFIDRNLINMNFRVSDTEYVINECRINFSRVKKGINDVNNEDFGTVVITRDKVQCEDKHIHKFVQDGLHSYRMRLIKELNTEREIEYVSVPSPTPSELEKAPEKPPMIENPVEPTGQGPSLVSGKDKLQQVTVQELPWNLVKRIQYKSRRSLSDSDSTTENQIPMINGMKTVPLKIPPSNGIAGHLFVSLQVQSNFLYYFSKEKTLDQILAATNSSPTTLASALLASDSVRQCPPSNSSMHSSSSVVSSSNRNSSKKEEKRDIFYLSDSPSPVPSPEKKKKIPSRLDQYEDNNGYHKSKDHVCECWCSKVRQKEKGEARPEMEETREVKTINIMVDCDDCGKTFKDGTNHKCLKKKGGRMEQKVLVCEICQRTFSRQAHLSNHMRSHKDYLKSTVKCELCNRRFQKKGEFAKHKAECHPETVKDHFCDECGERFQTSKKLNLHKRTHEAESDTEMDVRCVHCNGSYPVHYYRTRHLKECTENNPQINNSRTNGSVTVTMRKPVAIRSNPVLCDDSDTSEDEYMEVQMLEEHRLKMVKIAETESEESVMLPKYKNPVRKKRRFMNLDAPTTDSETEEPPRKFSALRSRLSRNSSEEESEYIGGEEVYYLEGEEDEDDGTNNVDFEDMPDYESTYFQS